MAAVKGPETPEVVEVVRSGGRSLPVVRRFDAAVDAWFEPLRRNPTANRVFYLASEAADFSVGWHLIATGRALLAPQQERSAVRMVLALGVESAFVNGLLKQAFRRTRPTITELAPHAIRRPRTSSFPSGHASSATMAAILLSERSRLGPVWAVAAAVVAASRVHTRMHHASDVVGGVIVGAAIGVLVRRVAPLPPR